MDLQAQTILGCFMLSSSTLKLPPPTQLISRNNRGDLTPYSFDKSNNTTRI